MTKNEIVARWMNLPEEKEYDVIHYSNDHHNRDWLSKECLEDVEHIPTTAVMGSRIKQIDLNYETLHEAWVKFRDLKYKNQELADDHFHWCNSIHTAIGYLTITEAFDELVKGIEWYESLKK